MKILMLAQESYLNPMGGLTIYMEEVCKRLHERGHDVTWLGVEPQQQEHYDSRERGYRHICASNTLQTRNIGSLFHQMNLMEIYPMLLAHLKDEEYDIIQLNDSYLYRCCVRLARRLFKCPFVSGSHLSFILNTGAEYASALPDVYQYEFQQELNAFHNSAANFTVSDFYADKLQSYLMLPERPEVIHNGVDIEPLMKAEPDYEDRKRRAGDKQMFVFCGRFVDYKGVRLVVDAARECPDKHFVLISSFTPGIEETYSLSDYVEQAVRDLPNLDWENDMRFDSKWGLMKAADAGIAPSLNDEPFGIAALEWMGLGKNLITTAAGGMQDFCNDSNSFIIEKSTESLVKCLKNFKVDKTKISNGLRTARELSWDKTTDGLESFLKETIREQQSMGANNVNYGNNDPLQVSPN